MRLGINVLIVGNGNMFRKAIEISPGAVGIHGALAMALMAQDRGEEALAEAALEADPAWRLRARAILLHHLRRLAESEAALSQ